MRYRNILSLIFIFVFPTSCSRETFLDAKNTPMIVVECILTNKPVQELRLSLVDGKGKSESSMIVHPEIKLTDITMSTVVGHFEQSGPEYWTLEYMPSAGHKYHLDIEIDGYDQIFADDLMPEFNVQTTHITSREQAFEQNNDWNEIIDDCYCPKDNAEEYESFYNGHYIFPGYYYKAPSLPDFCIVYFVQKSNEAMVKSGICSDYGDIIGLNISDERYDNSETDFGRTFGIRDQKNSDAVFEISYYPTLQGLPMYKDFLLIRRNLNLSRKWFTVSGYPKKTSRNLVFCALSENYYKYLIDALSEISDNHADLSSIYLRESSFSNINGGLGIFGTSWSQKVEWSLDASIRNVSSEIEVYDDETGKHWRHKE